MLETGARGYDPDESISENPAYVVPTYTVEATKQLDVLTEKIKRMQEESKIENASIENLAKISSNKTWAKSMF
uniref:Uncharacterized protein n=1 Tax=Daphnia galeata TaxID=27404 RepID=A0A8J2WGP0_9CRUS|nr:unnamed protein product [Daphnia galeata]